MQPQPPMRGQDFIQDGLDIPEPHKDRRPIKGLLTICNTARAENQLRALKRTKALNPKSHQLSGRQVV